MRSIICLAGLVGYRHAGRNPGGNLGAPRLLFQITEHFFGGGFADAGSAVNALQELSAVGSGRHIGAGAV